ncbi:MAG: bifunctional oligoribonuclease/PAP phosphatase NrnA [Patescibacteria group bacterium]
MKQNYSSSQSILTEIKKARNILINIHRNPDLDSVGSATAMYQALIKMGKKVTLVCPHKIPENFKFLKGADKVKTIDFKDLSGDLFLILDSGSYDIVTGSKEIKLPEIKKIIIDHHLTNNWKDYQLRLLDTKASATAEIVYHLLTDWGSNFDKNISTALLSGIAGDTVFFKYPKNPVVMFSLVSELMKKGANYNLLIKNFNDSLSFEFVKLLGEFLNNVIIENLPNGKFVWSAVPFAVFEKYGRPRGARETAADSFFRSIKGVDFGVALLEEKKRKISMSFRSKENFDVSKIAEQFGGGGHRCAAGATVYGDVDQIIKKIKKVVL